MSVTISVYGHRSFFSLFFLLHFIVFCLFSPFSLVSLLSSIYFLYNSEVLMFSLSSCLTRAHWHRENILILTLGNHDTVKELGSLVQQAQIRACVMSNRGSGNCAESRTQTFASAVEKFFPRQSIHNIALRWHPFEPRPTSKDRDLRPSVVHNSA